MIKSELTLKVARKNNITRRDACRIVDIVLDEITDTLAADGRVELRGFGIFSTHQRDARIGRNPKTGKSVSVEPKSVPFFKAGKALKKNVSSL